MSELILGGSVNTVLQFGPPEALQSAIDRARREQEEICGYELVCTDTRVTETTNDKGHRIFEVFATFSPAPAEAAPLGLPPARPE